MTDFVIVASALALFFGFGIAMGTLLVAALARRRTGTRYLGGGWGQQELPGDDEKSPWYHDR